MPKDWSGPEGISTHFAEMMNDTIVFNAQSAIDKYGKKTFSGSTTTASGRIVLETRLMKDMEGQDIVSTGRVYLYGAYTALTLGHRITLPGGANPVIVAVETKKDTGGNHHTIVHFGV